MGDNLARIPAVKYTYDFHPHIIQLVWVPDYFVDIAKRMLPIDRQRLIIRGYSQLNKKFNKSLQARAFSVHKYTNLASHMTDHSFAVLCYTQVEDKYKNYLEIKLDDVDVTRFNLPEKYVVIPPNFTSNTRIFLGDYINTISDYCNSIGYTPVYLGNSLAKTGGPNDIKSNIDPKTDLTKGIDLLNQTSLLESAKIIKGSSLVIGLDNGLLHLAASTGDDTKVVYGFTTVKPDHRLPYRKDIKGYNTWAVTVNSCELGCIGCQSNFNFTYNHDFKSCYYSDYLCLLKLTPEKYIKAINEALNIK